MDAGYHTENLANPEQKRGSPVPLAETPCHTPDRPCRNCRRTNLHSQAPRHPGRAGYWRFWVRVPPSTPRCAGPDL